VQKLLSYQPFFAIHLSADLSIEKDHLTAVFEWKDLQNQILWPNASSGRQDELWQHTCFEIFLRPSGGEKYFEMNVTPDGAWNSFEFTHYRKPQPPTPTEHFSLANVISEKESLTSIWNIRELPLKKLAASLTAVLELKNQQKTYWALKHQGQKPDFHHPDTFILERFL
jgi:hypothetical protein